MHGQSDTQYQPMPFALSALMLVFAAIASASRRLQVAGVGASAAQWVRRAGVRGARACPPRSEAFPTASGGISHSERSATPSVGSQSSNRLPGTRLPTLRVDRPASPILDRSLAGVLSGRVTRGRTRLTPRCSEACRPAAHLAASPSGRRARPPKAGARSAVFGDHQQTIAGWAARGAQELGQRAGLRINAPSGGMRRRIE